MYRFLLLLLPITLLAGCASVSPNTLGIPQDQWEQYSDQQRKSITNDYHKTQKAKKSAKHSHSTGAVLAVDISKGRVLMPPYSNLQPYQPISFNIQDGECNKKINVVAPNNPKQKTVLSVCYKDDVLYLDPSPYEESKALGSLQFHVMPIWRRGFTYPSVISTGFVKLTNVDISVHQLRDGGE